MARKSETTDSKKPPAYRNVANIMSISMGRIVLSFQANVFPVKEGGGCECKLGENVGSLSAPTYLLPRMEPGKAYIL
jgi:hypothetical protein